MNPQELLEKLGYTPHEVEIYLASLKMGEATIADLVEHVSLPRTTVAETLEQMHRNGLMGFYIKHNHKYWVAENPERLMAILKDRENSLTKVLPQLLSMRRDSEKGKPNIRLYFGIDEIKQIMDDIIETKHNIMSLVSEDDFRSNLGAGFMDDFVKRRNEHFLKIQLIAPRAAHSTQLKNRDATENRRTKFLPENMKIGHVSNFIYGDKVAIITLNQKEPTGIVIQDPDVAAAMRIYFETLWQVSLDR